MLVVALLLGCQPDVAPAAPAPPSQSEVVPVADAKTAGADYTPKYDDAGDLLRPKGFETWVFVGSNVGLGYGDDLPAMTAREAKRSQGDSQSGWEFHNVHLDPVAYEHYVCG